MLRTTTILTAAAVSAIETGHRQGMHDVLPLTVLVWVHSTCSPIKESTGKDSRQTLHKLLSSRITINRLISERFSSPISLVTEREANKRPLASCTLVPPASFACTETISNALSRMIP